MATVAAPNIRKQQFENRDRGWVGVAVIDGKGDVTGKSVQPGGRVWLSEAEKIVTAEAPQDPADNPFVPQTRIRLNEETGQREEYQVTPLVPVTDARFVPASERYVPPAADDSSTEAEAFAAADAATTKADHDRRAAVERQIVEGAASTTVEAAPGEPPRPPARAAQAAAHRLGGENVTREVPAEEPPKPARLGGENPSEEEEAAVQEETAAQVDPEVGEETGAAQEPAGEPVEGEYARHEEVGTPAAPKTTPNMGGPPAPWTPGSQPGS